MNMKYLAIILAIAALLRLYQLGSLPAGFSWDEAAIGYNGFGIWTVHRDEWLSRMPIVFKSFGDYKAAVAIYLAALTTALFGLSEFSTRLPMALAGIVTVAATYGIARVAFKRQDTALFSALLVALSPLNVHYSRIAFESGVAVSMVAAGILCALLARKRPFFYLPAGLLLVGSMYAYHSTKITVPLMTLAMAWSERERLRRQVKWVVFAVMVSLIALYPLANEMVRGNGSERFYMTSIIVDRSGLKPMPAVLRGVSTNIAAHVNPRYLLFGGTTNYRHGNNVFGILGYSEAVFLGIALLFMVKRNGQSGQRVWLLVFTVIAVIPAIISSDAPNSNRMHGVVPWVQLLAAGGITSLLERVPDKRPFVVRFLVVLVAIQTVFYAYVYKRVYSGAAAYDFQYGYREAVLFARSYESRVAHILFTSAYGQPYIYFLYYKQLNPIQWQQGALANYELRDVNWEGDRTRKQTLIIGTGTEIPSDAKHVVKEIFFPNGQVAFRAVLTE